MSTYDLGEVLRGQLKGACADVSNPDTSGREQIEYIDINLIDDDPKNFYTLSGLDKLASNIALLGLQQPLRVRPNPEDPQRVVIVSGHRRRAAIQKLVEEGRTDLQQIPCIREGAEDSAALQELRLIYANSDTRTLTNAELSRQAERVEELLYLLKEEGLEFPGRMRDHVAEACRISAPKLARLKVIRENLVPEYMKIWERNKLPEATAYALARLPAEFQVRMASVLSKPPDGTTAEKVLKKYQEGWRWEPDLQCPDGKPCKRGDTFLRRDCECTSWDGFCGGKTCCLACDKATRDWSPCERMCSRAKAQRKTVKDEKEKREHLRKQTAGRKYQRETQGYARRLLLAIDAAGVAEDAKIVWSPYYAGISVSVIRQWAAGEFDDPAGWSYARLIPEKCDNAPAVACLLNCSTDYLLGMTDDFRLPAASDPPDAETAAPETDSSFKEPVSDVSELDTFSEDETGDGCDTVSARRIRWESRFRTPPVGKAILTYDFINDSYIPALWDGSDFRSLDGREVLPDLRYSHWLEIPPPASGEEFQLAPTEEAEGQLVISTWMPGGTLPAEPCDIVADFLVPGEAGQPKTNLRRICWFDGTYFLFKRHGSRVDAECVRWMALPPVADVSELDTGKKEDKRT